jgi:spermidine synthase
MNHRLNSINFDSNRLLPFLVILFMFSGCAALIYEVIWLQMLQLVIGLTSVSLGVLLGTFMGGMCLGSLLLSRIISIKHHPLKIYAILEICIGLIGLALLFGMPLIENIYTRIAGHGIFQSILLRSLIASVCLLPPTILMGATLPAISRWVETTPRGVSWMGFFYGSNIFGGVLGCLLSGFYLLRVFDVGIATWLAFCLNLIIAISALIISRITNYNCDQVVTNSHVTNSSGLKVVYITIALSGMAALGSEVIWTRLLSIMMGSTVYTFSIILAAFLVGLGIGSGAGALLSRKIKRPALALGICQFFLILTIAWASFIITNTVPNRPLDISMMTKAGYIFWNDLGFCTLAVLPPTIFWGASFPLALAAVASKGQDPGRLVGGIYASDTIGAIIGSLAFSLIGFTILGSKVSQQILVLISGVAAILMFSVSLCTQKSAETFSIKKFISFVNLRFAGVTIIIAFIVVLVVSNIQTIPWGAVAYGKYMPTHSDLLGSGKTPPEQTVSPTKLIYIGEGLNGSVAVTELSGGVRQFHSVGKVQASTDPQDMRLQRMLGHFAGLLTENPESVLVIGCGAGITAGTFITYPEIREIVICDIESLVPKFIAPLFSTENYGIADGIENENPHIVNGKEVRFEYDDGRHFISTSDLKFDIITTDPIDPWAKGAAALYTLEFFKMCKAHLKPGGTMTVWIPLYQSSIESVKSMVSTFFKVFPDGIIWSNDNYGEGYDMVLFGQDKPTHIDLEKLEKKLSGEDYRIVRRSLADVNFFTLEDFLGTYAGCARDLKEWMSGAQINTDRNMRLSYLSGLSAYYYAATEIFYDITKYYKFPENLFSGSDQKLDSLDLSIKYKMW